MLEILLCDDDRFFLSIAEGIIGNLISEERLPAHLCGVAHSYSEAVALSKRVSGKNSPALAFLDLDFGRDSPTGIDVSRAIKRICPNLRIVFLTNHNELALSVLKSGAEPFGFLEKGTDITRLLDGMRRYVRMALSYEKARDEKAVGGREITLEVGGEPVNLRVDDITYLESEKNLSHGITYHTLGGSKITVIGTLDKAELALGGGFMRVHRSYLVNSEHIIALRGSIAVLSDGGEVPCSLKKRGDVSRILGAGHEK